MHDLTRITVGKTTALQAIPKSLVRMLCQKGDAAAECRTIFERLIDEVHPKGTISYFILYDIAKVIQTLQELQGVRDATLAAALRAVVEQCLKDTPSDEPPEVRTKYILVGAKKEALGWSRNKEKRRKIDARLYQAGYNFPWIEAKAFELVKDQLSHLDRAIAFHEERRRRLINQVALDFRSLPENSPRLLEGRPEGSA